MVKRRKNSTQSICARQNLSPILHDAGAVGVVPETDDANPRGSQLHRCAPVTLEGNVNRVAESPSGRVKYLAFHVVRRD